ncbi:MAG: histidinol-phosphate aminotransferase family protein [Sulfolobales archaeon]|nr:histidinol-phosphate aminotransferase family protein [Sulfolobales archaeon]MCX8208331.1 histidinol-phosphate aminotransferase family protein [Sulfolobales archaeon]
MSIRKKISRKRGDSVGSCRHHGGTSSRDLLDFSAPQNPLGTPEIIRELVRESVAREDYSRYPDYTYRRLREAIASFYKLDYESVVPLNGGSEALYILVLSLRPTSLVVFEPTFGDHRCLAESLNLKIVSVPYIESGERYEFPIDRVDELRKTADRNSLFILSNPNNPTGTALSAKQVVRLLNALSEFVVVVDEAFFELCYLCDEVSALKLAKSYENLVVVRSLTKTYSIPGLRIGFLYTENGDLLNAVESSRAPWNVNSIAEAVISEALEKYSSELRSFAEKSKAVIRKESTYLERGLRLLGIRVYSSTAPFLLVKHSTPTSEISKKLRELRVVVRDASTYPYLTQYHARVSVRLRSENEVLLGAYRRVVENATPSES